MFAWTFQPGLLDIVQCFSLTTISISWLISSRNHRENQYGHMTSNCLERGTTKRHRPTRRVTRRHAPSIGHVPIRAPALRELTPTRLSFRCQRGGSRPTKANTSWIHHARACMTSPKASAQGLTLVGLHIYIYWDLPFYESLVKKKPY
jgi:hypothetical protein